MLLLSGTVKWAKVRQPENDPDNYDFGKYTVDLYPDDKSWKKFKDAKLIIKPKSDKEGAEFLKLSRKDEEKTQDGDVEKKGPPRVYLKDAQSGEYQAWDEGLIGNGSEVTVTLEVYRTRYGNAHRLIRVFVDKLVEYVPMKEADAPAQAETPF